MSVHSVIYNFQINNSLFQCKVDTMYQIIQSNSNELSSIALSNNLIKNLSLPTD